MYLGFFFIYWGSNKSKVVYASDPQSFGVCPFCQTDSTAIFKIYNTSTQHWGWLELGEGEYKATFTCRNCTTEGGFERRDEEQIIKKFKYNLKFRKIVEVYKKKPEKALVKLQKLLNEYRRNMGSASDEISNKMTDTLHNWNQSRSNGTLSTE